MTCLMLFILQCFIARVCFAREPLMVNIPEQGSIEGKEVSMVRTQRINAYLGIPYAQPPIGDLRFAAPVNKPLPSWDGVRNATSFAPGCLQNSDKLEKHDIMFLKLLPDQELGLSEDCLYLNVFVPHGVPPPSGYATMVWIHPGNFTTGNPAVWDPYALVFKQRVIVVTFAYRLNILGFFTTMDGEAPGNYGLFDQVAALEWVKSNIKLFGGNESSITLFGHGAGGISAGLHMISPYSENLFTRVITMSGNALTPGVIKMPADEKSTVDYIADYFGCFRTPTSSLIHCLRRVDAGLIVDSANKANWGPIYDANLSNSSRPFIPDSPKTLFKKGEFQKVPLLCGYTDMEEALILDIEMPENDADIESESENVSKRKKGMLGKLAEKLIRPDVPPFNPNETCNANQQLVLDALMFYYKPSYTKKPDSQRSAAIKMVTDKRYASSSIQQAKYVSKKGVDAYVYRFEFQSRTQAARAEFPEWVSVPHLYDLVFVWGLPYWASTIAWESSDKRTSDIIMNFWTNFAKDADPTKGSFLPIRWDKFDPDDPAMLIIDRSFNMSDAERVDYKAFAFWNSYYPKILDVATTCCNSNQTEEDIASSIAVSKCIFYSLVTYWFIVYL